MSCFDCTHHQPTLIKKGANFTHDLAHVRYLLSDKPYFNRPNSTGLIQKFRRTIFHLRFMKLQKIMKAYYLSHSKRVRRVFRKVSDRTIVSRQCLLYQCLRRCHRRCDWSTNRMYVFFNTHESTRGGWRVGDSFNQSHVTRSLFAVWCAVNQPTYS